MAELSSCSAQALSLSLQPGPEAQTKLSLQRGGRRFTWGPSLLPILSITQWFPDTWHSLRWACAGWREPVGSVQGKVWGKQVCSVWGEGSRGAQQDVAPGWAGPEGLCSEPETVAWGRVLGMLRMRLEMGSRGEGDPGY